MSFFDSETVEDVSFKPLVVGWYHAVIIGYDFRPNKNNNGMVLELEFEVQAMHKKKVKCYYNLQHQNPDAQSIGRSMFKSVCMAVEMPKIENQSDLALLVGKRVGVYLGIREYDGKQYNDVKDVKHINVTEAVEEKAPKTYSDDDFAPF